MKEFKPGDVVLVEAGCWANRKVAIRLAEGWAHANGTNLDEDGVVTPIRRLLTIDPEDREQVERLCRAHPWHGAEAGLVDHMQAALREFANPKPPKPEEPTGLGAVVEDADGHLWVYRGGPQPAAGRVWFCHNLNGTALYDEITAVRVLSEGVQP